MSKASPRLRWLAHPVANGMEIVVPDGGTLSVNGTADHGYVISSRGPLLIGLWYGPGEDLARWRGGFEPDTDPGATFGRETKTRVCGRMARRLEAHTPSRPPASVAMPGGETSQQFPAKDSIAVELEHGGAPAVAYYVIESDQRAAYAADEERFFASIRCQ